MRLSAAETAQAVGGRIILGSGNAIIENISTDSNSIRAYCLFVPIVGAKFDAHKFILGAAKNGAIAAFSAYDLPELAKLSDMSVEAYAASLQEAYKASKANRCENGKQAADLSCAVNAAAVNADNIADSVDTGFTIIRLDNARDGLEALQALGAYYRTNYVHIPYIGITGSVGKTTTREMTAAALSASYKVYSTKGNANSQSGTPITVAETDEDAKLGIIEMGMSEPGEMSRLSRIVQCDTAVFTVIGVSHIANLGSRENIMREKLHILDCIKQGGTLILNADDDMLGRDDIHDFFPAGTDEKQLKIIYYGTCDKANVRATDISEDGGCYSYKLIVDGKYMTKVALSVPGEHMLLNSLAALSAAYVHGADMIKAAENVGAFKSLDGRGRIYESKGITIINDAYNAAPQSVKAGLKVLNSMRDTSERRIAVLADMLELGENEADFHREVGAFIASDTPDIDIVMLYGRLSKYTAEGIKLGFCEEPSGHMPWVYFFDTAEELEEALKNEIYAGDAVLFKGSNSMKLGALAKKLYPKEDTDSL